MEDNREERKKERKERKERKAREAKEYADKVAGRKFRRAEIERLRAEIDELRKFDVSSSGRFDKKAYPVRMTIEVRDDFNEIAVDEKITQQELIEHFVMLYHVDAEEREQAWSKLFTTRAKVLAQDDASIEELEFLLESKKKERKDKEERRIEILKDYKEI